MMTIRDSADRGLQYDALTVLVTGFHSAIGTRRKMEGKK